MMSSSLTDEITIPRRPPADPEVQEVLDGICAYVQPDGSSGWAGPQVRDVTLQPLMAAGWRADGDLVRVAAPISQRDR
jgi:hypothetical protein